MSSGRSWVRDVVLVVLLFVLVSAALFFMARARIAAAPSLAGLDALLSHRRYDEAEQRLRKFLQWRPDDPQANMLMAQVALARDDQQPALALEHLGKVQVENPAARAIVLLNYGKAHSALGDYVRAEDCWKEALRIDPRVPEAGWALLGQYYVQGRRDDAQQLGMQLYATEPDPRDRAQLLLELLRQDAKSLVIETIVPVLRPVADDHPDDVHTVIALARALIATSQQQEGLERLRGLVETSGSPLAWEAYLDGLDGSYRFDDVEKMLARLPVELADDARFLKARGSLAQSRRDWGKAVDFYRRALNRDPANVSLLYRLGQTLRAAGRGDEAERLEPRRRALDAARERALRLYEEADAASDLGVSPHADLCHRLAQLREQMGRPEEALAWHATVLRLDPSDPTSRAAVERLTTRSR